MTKSFLLNTKRSRAYKLENSGPVSGKILKYQRSQIEKAKLSLANLESEIKTLEMSLNSSSEK